MVNVLIQTDYIYHNPHIITYIEIKKITKKIVDDHLVFDRNWLT